MLVDIFFLHHFTKYQFTLSLSALIELDLFYYLSWITSQSLESLPDAPKMGIILKEGTCFTDWKLCSKELLIYHISDSDESNQLAKIAIDPHPSKQTNK